MAVYVFTTSKVTVNSVDLSDHVKKVTLKTSADEKDTTAMQAAGGYRTRLGGLLDYQLDIEFNQDFAAGKVDATFFPILGTVVPFTVKRDVGANSVTNPEYQGNILVKEYAPLDGAVGDLGVSVVSFPGSGLLTRAVV